MDLTAQVLAHLSGQRLLVCLLRLPLRFDPLQVLGFDGFVPILTTSLLVLGACHMSVLHRLLLSVCGRCMTISVLFALAPSGGPRPVGLPCCLSHRLDRFRLPGGAVMLY